MTTITELKPTPSATAANGPAAARQATGGNAARTRGLMREGVRPAAEAFAEAGNGVAELGRGNLEAAAQSARACVTGMQDLGRQYVAAVLGLTRHALEDAEAFAGVRSPQDAMILQASLARASAERALGEGARLQRAAVALAERVHAPLARRAAEALGRTALPRAA